MAKFEDTPNLGQIMKHQPNLEPMEDQKPTVQPVTVTGGQDPAAMIRQATGLNIDPMAVPVTVPMQPEEKKQTDQDIFGVGVLTPEEAAQFNNVKAEKINETEEALRERNEKAEKISRSGYDTTIDMIQNAIKAEDARVERHTEALEDEETRKKIMTPDMERESNTVHYRADFDQDKEDSSRSDDIVNTSDEMKNLPKSPFEDELIDEDELVPSYDDDSEETEEDDTAEVTDVPRTKTKRPAPEDSQAVYIKYVKDLETTTLPELPNRALTVTRERSIIEPVPSGRMKSTKSLGDQAFLNSINKFKRDNFRTVTIPLVNSGFCVDIVGTGAVDLALLYNNTDQNTDAATYEIEKMRVILRNVVGTHPKVDKNDLRNMIHFADYQLMAYAHIAATLKNVEILQQCEDCGNDFHIVADSADLIMNMDELQDRMTAIRNTDDISQYSLMTTNKQMTTNNGFIVHFGYPSYADYINYLAEMKALSTNRMNQAELNRIRSMAAILPYVRNVILPNRVHTTNLYQRFVAITMLEDQDYNELESAINKMKEKIIWPRFGVKKVVCPYCKKVNTDIPYENLQDLLFFHFMVSRMTNSTDD